MKNILELSMYTAVQPGAHHTVAKANGNDLFIFWHDEYPKLITAFKVNKEDETLDCIAGMRYSDRSWYLDEEEVQYGIDASIWYEDTDLNDMYGEILEIHGEAYAKCIKFTHSTQEFVMNVDMKYVRRSDLDQRQLMGYIIEDKDGDTVAKLASIRGIKKTHLYKKDEVFKIVYELFVTR